MKKSTRERQTGWRSRSRCTGCSGKIGFFLIFHCNIAYIAVRDLHCVASVLLLVGNFCTTNWSREAVHILITKSTYLDNKKHMLQDNSCVPLLVLANKQDLPHAASPTQVKTGGAKRPLQITLSVCPSKTSVLNINKYMYLIYNVCVNTRTYIGFIHCALQSEAKWKPSVIDIPFILGRWWRNGQMV